MFSQRDNCKLRWNSITGDRQIEANMSVVHSIINGSDELTGSKRTMVAMAA